MSGDRFSRRLVLLDLERRIDRLVDAYGFDANTGHAQVVPIATRLALALDRSYDDVEALVSRAYGEYDALSDLLIDVENGDLRGSD